MACDIVLTVYNNLELTRKCLESIFSCWRQQDSLIIVDNGSDAQTGQFLGGLPQAHPDKDISLVRLTPNQGFIKAANAGLSRSKKENACLLSNDTVVTAGWLDEIEGLCKRHPDIGIAGPQSNTYGLHPKRGQSPGELAGSLQSLSGSYVESASCVGFCMFIRREVMQKIGFLDEAFGQGYFEDTDFCRRAIAAGFRCVIAAGAYVWHREHSTFLDAARDALFQRNKKIFQERWGIPERILCIVPERSADPALFEKETGLCLGLARKGNWVWVIGASRDRKELFHKLGIHGNIKVLTAPRPLLGLRSLLLVLARQKKKIDCLYVRPAFAQKNPALLSLCARPIKEYPYG